MLTTSCVSYIGWRHRYAQSHAAILNENRKSIICLFHIAYYTSTDMYTSYRIYKAIYVHKYVYVLLKACFMHGNWHSDIIHIILIVLMLNKHVGINNTCAACMCGMHEHIVALTLLPVYTIGVYIIITFLAKLICAWYTLFLVNVLQLPFLHIATVTLKNYIYTHIFISQSSYQFVVIYNRKVLYI